MPRSYRRFSREFKMQIVESILKGAVASQVAKANDLHPEVVRKWVRDFKAYQKDAFAGRGKAYTDNAKVGELERQLGQMAAENLVLKKALQRIKDLPATKARNLPRAGQGTHRHGGSNAIRYGALDDHDLFACVQHSSIGVLSLGAAAAAQGDLRVVAAIKDILIKHPRYGYRQVTDRLRRKRIVINVKRTLRLMRCHGLQHKPLRRPKWRGGHAAGELANLSQFSLTAPDQLWVT